LALKGESSMRAATTTPFALAEPKPDSNYQVRYTQPGIERSKGLIRRSGLWARKFGNETERSGSRGAAKNP
jgi:hypothetical protein